MRNFLITTAGIVFIALCCGLSKFWIGLLYFGLSGLVILTVYWAIILIIEYKKIYYDEFDEHFKFYIVNLINYSQLTREDINKDVELYKKKFKKTLVVAKVKKIAIISVLFVVAILTLSIMISGKIS